VRRSPRLLRDYRVASRCRAAARAGRLDSASPASASSVPEKSLAFIAIGFASPASPTAADPCGDLLTVLWNRRRALPQYAKDFFEFLDAYMREVFPISRPSGSKAAGKTTR